MPYEKKNDAKPKAKQTKESVPVWNSAKVINLPINSKHIEYHGEIYLG